MHARFSQSAPVETGGGVRGTFYPSEAMPGARSVGPALVKLVAVVVALGVVRTILANHGRHDGEPRRSRRRQMIAELHRELHAEDASEAA